MNLNEQIYENNSEQSKNKSVDLKSNFNCISIPCVLTDKDPKISNLDKMKIIEDLKENSIKTILKTDSIKNTNSKKNSSSRSSNNHSNANLYSLLEKFVEDSLKSKSSSSPRRNSYQKIKQEECFGDLNIVNEIDEIMYKEEKRNSDSNIAVSSSSKFINSRVNDNSEVFYNMLNNNLLEDFNLQKENLKTNVNFLELEDNEDCLFKFKSNKHNYYTKMESSKKDIKFTESKKANFESAHNNAATYFHKDCHKTCSEKSFDSRSSYSSNHESNQIRNNNSKLKNIITAPSNRGSNFNKFSSSNKNDYYEFNNLNNNNNLITDSNANFSIHNNSNTKLEEENMFGKFNSGLKLNINAKEYEVFKLNSKINSNSTFYKKSESDNFINKSISKPNPNLFKEICSKNKNNLSDNLTYASSGNLINFQKESSKDTSQSQSQNNLYSNVQTNCNLKSDNNINLNALHHNIKDMNNLPINCKRKSTPNYSSYPQLPNRNPNEINYNFISSDSVNYNLLNCNINNRLIFNPIVNSNNKNFAYGNFNNYNNSLNSGQLNHQNYSNRSSTSMINSYNNDLSSHNIPIINNSSCNNIQNKFYTGNSANSNYFQIKNFSNMQTQSFPQNFDKLIYFNNLQAQNLPINYNPSYYINNYLNSRNNFNKNYFNQDKTNLSGIEEEKFTEKEIDNDKSIISLEKINLTNNIQNSNLKCKSFKSKNDEVLKEEYGTPVNKNSKINSSKSFNNKNTNQIENHKTSNNNNENNEKINFKKENNNNSESSDKSDSFSINLSEMYSSGEEKNCENDYEEFKYHIEKLILDNKSKEIISYFTSTKNNSNLIYFMKRLNYSEFKKFFYIITKDFYLVLTKENRHNSKLANELLKIIVVPELNHIWNYLKNDFYNICSNYTGSIFFQNLLKKLYYYNQHKELKEIENYVKKDFKGLSRNGNSIHFMKKIFKIFYCEQKINFFYLIENYYIELIQNCYGITLVKFLVKILNTSILFNNKVNDVLQSQYLELKNRILEKTRQNISILIVNKYGHYGVVFMIENWGVEYCYSLFNVLLSNIDEYLVYTYPLKVIKRILKHSTYVIF